MCGFTFCKYQQAHDEGLCCQIRAVKAKVITNFEIQDGYDEPASSFTFRKCICTFHPLPPGFVYLVLKTCKKQVCDYSVVVVEVLSSQAT